MLEKVRAAYTNYRSLSRAACIGLIICAALLYWLPGGFPPWAWRFLFQVLPTVPRLWQMQGFVILLPLMGLICLSLMLLLLWGMLVVAFIKMLQYWWYAFYERRRFLLELQEAELLAEQMAADEMQRVPVASSQQGYGVSHTAREGRTSPNATSRPPGAFQPVEARTQPGPATSGEVPTIQHIQSQAQPLPAVAAVSLYSSPALARGQLRLVPRPDSAPIRAGNDAAFGLSSNSPTTLVRLPDGQVSCQGSSCESPPGSPALGPPTRKEEDEWGGDRLDEFPEIEPSQQREPPGLQVGVGLHPGFQRKDAPNEDALFEIRGTHSTWSGLQQVGLFVVADGMRNSGLGQIESISTTPLPRLDGVSAGMEGREASRLAIQALSAVMVPALLSNAKVIFADLLQEGVYSANLAVYSRNREMAETNCKMGTTMTVALVVGPTAYVANVGNSRTYLYRKNRGLSQITRDHSPTAGLLKEGVITSEDSYIHPHRKVLERYLGRQASVEVDSFVVQLRSDDILLLCSDGLWDMVCDAEIEKIMRFSEPHPVQISTMLVQTALNHGGADNVSVIVVLYREA